MEIVSKHSYCLITALYEFYSEIEWRPKIEINLFVAIDGSKKPASNPEKKSLTTAKGSRG
ncbi:MAG: hypothetical protein ACJ749_09220 [Flavisolibacter sp.]